MTRLETEKATYEVTRRETKLFLSLETEKATYEITSRETKIVTSLETKGQNKFQK